MKFKDHEQSPYPMQDEGIEKEVSDNMVKPGAIIACGVGVIVVVTLLVCIGWALKTMTE